MKERLRYSRPRLLEIQTEEFAGISLQREWDRIRADLLRFGPDFEGMTDEEAAQLWVLIAFVMGAVEKAAGR